MVPFWGVWAEGRGLEQHCGPCGIMPGQSVRLQVCLSVLAGRRGHVAPSRNCLW